MDALSVAAPVHDARGAVVAAVSLVVRHGSVPHHTPAPLLRTNARAISRALVRETDPAPAASAEPRRRLFVRGLRKLDRALHRRMGGAFGCDPRHEWCRRPNPYPGKR
ncbi:MAG: hypothetical protein QOI36_5634 [Pseudonocardiales bacterium]|nr:hypothetical protein [Pseudonocardiales bacterium]